MLRDELNVWEQYAWRDERPDSVKRQDERIAKRDRSSPTGRSHRADSLVAWAPVAFDPNNPPTSTEDDLLGTLK